MYQNSSPTARLAFLNADWRDYQGTPAFDENENEQKSILISDYYM